MFKLSIVLFLLFCASCGSNKPGEEQSSENKKNDLENAIKNSDIRLINDLLKSGINANQKLNGKFPLELAATKDATVFVTLLNHGADPNNGARQIFLAAVSAGNERVIRILLGKIDITKNNISNDAISAAKSDKIKKLISDYNKQDFDDEFQEIASEYERKVAEENVRYELAKAKLELEKELAKQQNNKEDREKIEKRAKEVSSFEELDKIFSNKVYEKLKSDVDVELKKALNPRAYKYKNWHLVKSFRFEILPPTIKLLYFIFVNENNDIAFIVENYTDNKLRSGAVLGNNYILGLDKASNKNEYRNPNRWHFLLGDKEHFVEFR